MKKIAPIVITIVVSGVIGIYAFVSFAASGSAFSMAGKVLAIGVGVAAVALIGAMIYTLIHRLKEIDEEDKDDLSKY